MQEARDIYITEWGPLRTYGEVWGSNWLVPVAIQY